MSLQSSGLTDKSSEVVTDLDVSLVKTVILMALTTIAAGVVGYLLVNPSAGYGFLAIGVFITLFILQVLLVRDWKKIFIGALTISLALALPILLDIGQLPPYLVVAWVIFLLISAYTESLAIQKINNSIRVPFWKVSRLVFTKTFAAICLFATIVYAFIAPPSDSKLAAASGTAGEIAVVRPIKYFIPEFSGTTTAGELFTTLAAKTVEGQKFTQGLSSADRSKLVQDTAAKYKAIIEDRVGPIDPSLPVSSAIAKTASNYMAGLNAFGFFMVNLSVFLALWIFFKGISFFLYLPASFVIFLIYETLVVTNLISIQYESRSREVAVLK